MENISNLMGLFVKGDILDRDFKNKDFDRELTLNYSFRNRGSVRLSKGLFYTKEECVKRRKELIKKTLP